MLKLGSSGLEVKDVQLALAKLGYPLKGTGYFGNATYTAVRAFQKVKGLKIDGEVGPETTKALLITLPPTKPEVKQEIERPLWLTAGLALLGTREVSGSRDNPEIIDWAKEEGGSVAQNYTHDSIPWCALYANHILTSVGLPGTETLWALDFAGKWPATNLGQPAVGAFAPMSRQGGGHIMVVIGKDQHGNIMGLGGNQSDAVTIAPFARSRLNRGFWWPKSVKLPTKMGYALLPVVNSNGKVSSNER